MVIDQVQDAVAGGTVVEGRVVLVIVVAQAEVVIVLQVPFKDRIQHLALPAVPIGRHVAVDHHRYCRAAHMGAVVGNIGVLLVDQLRRFLVPVGSALLQVQIRSWRPRVLGV
ncbi:hypothetical protein D3C76_1406440 [compost metagenome]